MEEFGRKSAYEPIEIRDETENPHDGEPCVGGGEGGISVLVVFRGRRDGKKQRGEHASADCGGKGGIVGEERRADVVVPEFGNGWVGFEWNCMRRVFEKRVEFERGV